MEQRGTMTTKEVAYFLGFSVNTLYKRLKDGTFPLKPLPLPTRTRLFSRKAVEQYVASSVN